MTKHTKKLSLLVAMAGVLAAMLAIPSLAAQRDANGDKLPDRWEKRHDLSLQVDQAKRDQDRDGLRNMGEYKHGTDPRDADSDADGVDDETECEGHAGGRPHGPPPPPAEEPEEEPAG